jgi:hypothetical protein
MNATEQTAQQARAQLDRAIDAHRAALRDNRPGDDPQQRHEARRAAERALQTAKRARALVNQRERRLYAEQNPGFILLFNS